MIHRLPAIATLLAALVVATACEHSPSYAEERFGHAFLAAKDASIAAGRETGGEEREFPPMAGTTAEGVVENYHRNQEADIQEDQATRVGIVEVSENR